MNLCNVMRLNIRFIKSRKQEIELSSKWEQTSVFNDINDTKANSILFSSDSKVNLVSLRHAMLVN